MEAGEAGAGSGEALRHLHHHVAKQSQWEVAARITQGAQPAALGQRGGVRWGAGWEGGSKARRHM